jgi:two-component system, cell cycle sensor histidine kinase and response regulator CckA
MTTPLDLDRQMRSTQDRLQRIQQQVAAGSPDRDRLLTDAIAELTVALEELHVATEEIHEQNAELLATRQGLESERQRYQNLFDFAPDAYLVTDGQGTIQAINQAAATLLNVRRNFCVGKPLILFIAPPDRPLIYAQLERITQSTPPVSGGDAACAERTGTTLSPRSRGANSMLQSDPMSSHPGRATILVQDREVSLQPRGQVAFPATMSLSGESVGSGAGNEHPPGQVQLYWLFHDLRAQKQAQMQLRELNTALSNAVEGIARLDEQGRYLFVNEAYASMVGYTPAEMVGMNWDKTVHPDDLAAVVADYQHMLRTGKVQLVARGIRKDTSVFYKQLYMISAYDDRQQFTGHYCFMKDITDRQQAEQTIREQAALLDIASDAIFVRDLDHHILYWNQGAERLYGWSAAEALGQQANQLLQEDAAQLAAILPTLLDRGESQGELHKRTKTGKEVIVAVRWTLVRDEAGQPKSILTVNTNITDKKQLEEQFYQAQRLESLGTLASGIAHDLNNVLTPILALAQVMPLHQSNLDARSMDMLKIIENSAKRGANMVKQILTFSRGTDEDRTTLQVANLLREAIDMIQETFPPSITIHANIPDRSLWLVAADPTQLHQILMNLCVNARDAMPDGGTMTISAANFSVDRLFAQMSLNARVGNYVLITIADTGIGIPPAVRDRIFEPFFTTKEHGKGTGLGLATVMGIVKSYGGFIQVASEPGQGSQFKVYLPAAEGMVTKIEPGTELFQGHGELVLIVEDDLTVQSANQSIVESYNYRTLVANDGIEAIALYAQHQQEIAAVLMDMMMPNLDGITAIHTLITMNPQVKIVAMSGVPSNQSAALAAGAKIFLAKPYTLADLIRSLADLVKIGE